VLELLDRRNAQQLQAHAALREERRLHAILKELIVEAERPRTDLSRWIAVPDSAPPGAEHVDLAAIERRALGGPTLREHEHPRRRDFVSGPELAEIKGVAAVTVRGWSSAATCRSPTAIPATRGPAAPHPSTSATGGAESSSSSIRPTPASSRPPPNASASGRPSPHTGPGDGAGPPMRPA
jgi:hypothetical protein